MQPPRWFWPVVAACLVALTIATVLRLRYLTISDGVTLDTYRSRVCIDNGCLPWPNTQRR